MPANLPPDYFAAEQRFREAKTPSEKIECLEEMLMIMPKHKGTDKLRAELRRKISKLKITPQGKKGAGRHESVYRINKEGAGQVMVVGMPNTGKSSLVAALTNAAPEIADSPFTTWKPTPGMMPIDDIQIQLIDTPPLNRDYVESELMDLIRRADLIVLMVDLTAGTLKQFEESLAILQEHRISPAHLKKNIHDGRRLFLLPFLIVAAKSDDPDKEEMFEIFKELAAGDWPMISISVKTGKNIELFKRRMVEALNIIRVYAKTPGKKADMTEPFILKRGGTVDDFAARVHKDFLDKLKTARIWGSAAFDGQMVNRDYVLQDGDIVELHIK